MKSAMFILIDRYTYWWICFTNIIKLKKKIKKIPPPQLESTINTEFLCINVTMEKDNFPIANKSWSAGKVYHATVACLFGLNELSKYVSIYIIYINNMHCIKHKHKIFTKSKSRTFQWKKSTSYISNSFLVMQPHKKCFP